MGQIAKFCPIVSRSSIIKNSVSLNDVWQKIRLHYGFQSTGAHFLDLSNIHLSPDERPEDLYQRLMAFFEDNLLTVSGGISHQGETISTDEDLTPTLENTIVFLWLQLINPGLPQLVKQKYGSELRNKSLASLKPEISQALSSLLDELRSIEDSKAMRVGNTLSPRQSPFPGTGYARPRRYVSCILCKTAGRPHTTHSLVDCRFVPQRDRRLLASSRLVCDDPEECDPIDYSASEEVCDLLVSPTPAQPTAPSTQHVRIVQSPVLSTFYESHPVPLTLDTGATSNMIRESSARLFGFPITPASQMARQADGVTPMDVTGEVHCTLTRGDKSFELDALVVRQLDVDILAGNPFMVRNDIAVRPAHRKIIIGGSDVVHYGMTSRHIPQPTARRTQASLLRCPERTIVFPGEYIQLDTPIESDPDAVWALEPRLDSPSNLHLKPASAWPRPQNISSVDHGVGDVNSLLKKGEQLCQIRLIVNADSMVSCATPATSPAPSSQRARKPFSENVTVDPGHCLPDTIRNQFHSLHLEYDDVFNPAVSKYNGASGKIEAFVNIGPTLPPQRKGRLPCYADLLDPLDQATAGKESREKIIWTDDLTLAFQTAQKALRNHKSISIPRPSDSLWILTDGSVKNRGIAATMYIHRNGKLLLAGFFNAKLQKHQVTWLPCEIEALAIGAAIKHFSPYIIQSPHTTQLLTDSRPCVQAYDKLKRGEFSTSSRVTTFLSTVSRYLVHVRHIAGIDNLPSDFASRNPIECRNSSCQICKFIAELEDSVVRTTTVDAVLEGSVHMPFTSHAAWQATQLDCSDLRCTHAHLSQGTRPSKKETNLRDIKRYLKDVIIAADGFLVVRDSQPFQPIRERIVVPRSVRSGLLTALHIRFHHPSKYQTKRLFNRYFFALDTDKAIETLTSSCHHCQSLKAIPRHPQPQSSSDPPATIRVSFAADIVKRYRQLILVLRETVSSYTLTSLIESEKHEHLGMVY